MKRVNGISTRLKIGLGKYSGATVSNPDLTIAKAERDDEGYYICFATNSFGTGQSVNVFLDVVGGMSQFIADKKKITYSTYLLKSIEYSLF